MKRFGLVITTEKTYLAEGKTHARILARTMIEAEKKLRAVEADRDSAERHIKRLLHNNTELTTLWAAIRQVGHEKQIRQVYKRLMGISERVGL